MYAHVAQSNSSGVEWSTRRQRSEHSHQNQLGVPIMVRFQAHAMIHRVNGTAVPPFTIDVPSPGYDQSWSICGANTQSETGWCPRYWYWLAWIYGGIEIIFVGYAYPSMTNHQSYVLIINRTNVIHLHESSINIIYRVKPPHVKLRSSWGR